jgi:hypothetical protein
LDLRNKYLAVHEEYCCRYPLDISHFLDFLIDTVYCYTAGAAQVRAGENPDCLKHPGYELCEHNAAQTFYFVVHEEVQPSITVTIAIDNISP